MEKILSAIGLSKVYDNRVVLNNISFDVLKGEFISIMGPSGSGKSTLLNIISGNEVLDNGSVLINGEDITKYNEKKLSVLRNSTVGFVYQFFNLIEELSAYDNIMLPIYLKSKKIDLIFFNELIDDLNIKDLLNRTVSKLSGGEKQRVAIARSLIYKPQILMLDEPTGNLDTENRNNIMKLLKMINVKYSMTIIQVTHDFETTKYTDYIIKIIDGEIKR